MVVLQLPEAVGVALDQGGTPSLIGDQVPAVAVVQAVPGTDLDAPTVFWLNNFEYCADDAVLAVLRPHIAPVGQKPCALGLNSAVTTMLDDRHDATVSAIERMRSWALPSF
ncbi:hypothetical protein ACFPMG_11475 [Azospirillum himalayense]|uniref:Uncharacterized protein n=1 Tax=Azospirillum himalayense TaxID=654847 RepID=A0ABW0G3F1_9PROT